MKRYQMCNKSKKFSIQLLSGRCVVLVQTDGFESEIFIPEIWNNHILLRNVIKSRQACGQANELNMRIQGPINQNMTTATAGLAPKRNGYGAIGNGTGTCRLGNKFYPRFEIKVISNGHLVLVECQGYESEIFLPYISGKCVSMKRVNANLADCISQNSTKMPSSKDKYNKMIAELAAQPVGMSHHLVNPQQIFSKKGQNGMHEPIERDSEQIDFKKEIFQKLQNDRVKRKEQKEQKELKKKGRELQKSGDKIHAGKQKKKPVKPATIKIHGGGDS